MEKDSFLKEYNIAANDFEKTGLIWHELIAIKERHDQNFEELDQIAKDVADRMRKSSNKIHSVKLRVKNSEHLIEKIIRKRIKEPLRVIGLTNYQKEITDLIGVRVLHLFKEDWGFIHDSIMGLWDQAEDPKAYYREGDKEDYLKLYQDKGCTFEMHAYGYRSVHYTIVTKPTKNEHLVELQVRTLFEEAWSEIDHKVRYPYDQSPKLLTPYLVMFNGLAAKADEMGSFVMHLQSELTSYENKINEQKAELDKSFEQIVMLSKKLKIGANENEELENEIEKMKVKFASMSSFNPASVGFFPNSGVRLDSYGFLTQGSGHPVAGFNSAALSINSAFGASMPTSIEVVSDTGLSGLRTSQLYFEPPTVTALNAVGMVANIPSPFTVSLPEVRLDTIPDINVDKNKKK